MASKSYKVWEDTGSGFAKNTNKTNSSGSSAIKKTGTSTSTTSSVKSTKTGGSSGSIGGSISGTGGAVRSQSGSSSGSISGSKSGAGGAIRSQSGGTVTRVGPDPSPTWQDLLKLLLAEANWNDDDDDYLDIPRGSSDAGNQQDDDDYLSIPHGNSTDVVPHDVLSISCRSGYVYSQSTGRCEPVFSQAPTCPEGYVYSRGRCEPVFSRPCSEGFVYSQSTGRCEYQYRSPIYDLLLPGLQLITEAGRLSEEIIEYAGNEGADALDNLALTINSSVMYTLMSAVGTPFGDRLVAFTLTVTGTLQTAAQTARVVDLVVDDIQSELYGTEAPSLDRSLELAFGALIDAALENRYLSDYTKFVERFGVDLLSSVISELTDQ